MMRFYIIGIVFCQIAVQPQAEKFENRYPHTHHHEEESYEISEPRFHPHPHPHPHREYPNDIPITFKAPRYEAPDYWKTTEDYITRRTFYGDFSPVKTTPFPSLYQFMSSIFGRGTDYPDNYNPYNRPPPPHKSSTPFVFNPTEPNYIPPPKPIRASVIKLETITRSPVYPPYEYETTTKYYPHVGTILNHVLIENSKQNRTNWQHREEDILPPFKPLPVLPTPGFAPATTSRPDYQDYFDNRTRFPDYKYPDSVQDQLPHLNLDEVEIPYVSEKPVPQIFIPPRGEFYPGPLAPNILQTVRRERPNGPNPVFETATVKSFPGAVEKVKRPTFKYTKKLTAQLDRTPAERVANLTVLGFSNPDRKNPKPNIRVVADTSNNSHDVRVTNSTRPVNMNDELSLDAKILKDTNWDGWTFPPEPKTDSPGETTTDYPTTRQEEPKTKPNVTTAFWEIPDDQTTPPPTTESDATITTPDRRKTHTTTEFIWFSTTIPTTESHDTEETTPGKSASDERPESGKENLEKPEVTVRPEGLISRRKYSRRPKVVTFTPYPSPEDIHKKLTPRNHFPKRAKPNISLAFGNKNVLKFRQTSGGEELMKFSDEDLRKRKIGKRRQVYKRIRTSTSERPNQSDQL